MFLDALTLELNYLIALVVCDSKTLDEIYNGKL